MVEVSLPRLLDPSTGGRRSLVIEGDTIGEVVDGLIATVPGLKVHLFDEAGVLRPHVLCFVDGRASRLEDRSAPAGAELRFVQAISGG